MNNSIIINKLFFYTNTAVFFVLTFYYFNLANYSFYTFFCFPLYVYTMHNMMNFVHQSSHGLLFKHKIISKAVGVICAIFTMLSFSEFKATHLRHHAYTTNPEKDPDYFLSNQIPALLIPFFIWKKDQYFFKNKLWIKGKNGGKGLLYLYLLERGVQILLLILLILNAKFIFIGYYLMSLLILGYLNALFLFIFPHYKLNFEKKINQNSDNFIVRNLVKLINLPINISRDYHHKHHLNVKSVNVYYPIENYMYKLLFHQK